MAETPNHIAGSVLWAAQHRYRVTGDRYSKKAQEEWIFFQNLPISGHLLPDCTVIPGTITSRQPEPTHWHAECTPNKSLTSSVVHFQYGFSEPERS